MYLHLWRATHGRKTARAQIALQDIAEMTRLSKCFVQSALGWLVKRKLIAVQCQVITAIPIDTVRPWRR